MMMMVLTIVVITMMVAMINLNLNLNDGGSTAALDPPPPPGPPPSAPVDIGVHWAPGGFENPDGLDAAADWVSPVPSPPEAAVPPDDVDVEELLKLGS